MLAFRTTPVKWLAGFAASCLALAIFIGNESAVAEPADSSNETFTIDINFPAVVADGQFCQAYGLAWGGDSPYTFTWLSPGQFTGSGQTGPLGPGQIINGILDDSNPAQFILKVEDSSSNILVDTMTFIFDDPSDDCEA